MDPIGIAVALTVIAQQASPGDTLTILNLIVGYPLAAVLFWLLTDQIKERKATQALLNAQLERALPVLSEAAATLERVQEAQNAVRRSETADLERHLADVVTELRRGRGGP